MNQIFTVGELAAHVNGEIVGNNKTQIFRIASLETAQNGDLAFVENAKMLEQARGSAASCLIVSAKDEVSFSGDLIYVEQPKLAFAQIAALLHPPKRHLPKIHFSAVIADNAMLGENLFVEAFVCIGENSSVGDNTQIRAGAKIGDNVRIGKNCTIHPNVFIEDNVIIGDNVILHAGVIIGADGFGYVRAPDAYFKFPQIGRTVIEDEVEIGANTCVDRGALGETRIGKGTKIDNLVQIGHNVTIGERVIIAAQTGISGSTIIESDAVIGGQVGLGDHARVQSGAVIGSKAGVLPGKIVRAGVWWGVPVQPLEEYKRQNAIVKSPPRLREEIKELHNRLQDLESKIADNQD